MEDLTIKGARHKVGLQALRPEDGFGESDGITWGTRDQVRLIIRIQDEAEVDRQIVDEPLDFLRLNCGPSSGWAGSVRSPESYSQERRRRRRLSLEHGEVHIGQAR